MSRIYKYYVARDAEGNPEVVQGKTLQKFDAAKAIGEGLYLPAVARAVEDLAAQQSRIKEYEKEIERRKAELSSITQPLLLTKGKTDVIILKTWKRIRGSEACPFNILSCDTGGPGDAGGSGGVDKLAMSVKSVRADNPHIVIGLFDRDSAGMKGWDLDPQLCG